MGNFKHWFKDSWLNRHVISAIKHPERFIFLKKYPFWKTRNVWTGKFAGYDVSMYEWIPDGWRKAFGEQLTQDIVKAFKEDKIPKRKWCKNLQWQDIKEKYGTLRFYAVTTEKIQDVFEKYECLSMAYCINCGEPSKYITGYWVEYLCEGCFDQRGYSDKTKAKKQCRLSKKYLPVYTRYENGVAHQYTPKDLWGIDLLKMWGLKK